MCRIQPSSAEKRNLGSKSGKIKKDSKIKILRQGRKVEYLRNYETGVLSS